MSDIENHSRLKKLLIRYGTALEHVAKERERRGQSLSGYTIMERIARADPEPTKSNVPWLIHTYLGKDGYRLEDLGKAQHALMLFNRLRPSLPVAERDLTKLKSLGELLDVVQHLEDTEQESSHVRERVFLSGRARKRDERESAREESLILYEGELGIVAVPMTQQSAKWWGRGTRWCTAADEDNAFAEYHWSAPLIIIVASDGTKIQAYFEKADVQVMDARDESVIKEQLSPSAFTLLSKIARWGCQVNKTALSFTNPETLEESFLLEMAGRGGITQVRKILESQGQLPSMEMIIAALKYDSSYFDFLPPELQRFPGIAEMVLEKQDYDIFLPLARTYGWWGGDYVHKQSIIKWDKPDKPLDARGQTLLQDCLRNRGLQLRFVPLHFRSRELCMLAIQSDGMALRYVPDNLINEEMVDAALASNGDCINFLKGITWVLSLDQIVTALKSSRYGHVFAALSKDEVKRLEHQGLNPFLMSARGCLKFIQEYPYQQFSGHPEVVQKVLSENGDLLKDMRECLVMNAPAILAAMRSKQMDTFDMFHKGQSLAQILDEGDIDGDTADALLVDDVFWRNLHALGPKTHWHIPQDIADKLGLELMTQIWEPSLLEELRHTLEAISDMSECSTPRTI
jgi:Domain of unknown function (DUF4116)